ncbi:unnamed protein product, partial [Ectocarpus sp. 12 AP-2014]
MRVVTTVSRFITSGFTALSRASMFRRILHAHQYRANLMIDDSLFSSSEHIHPCIRGTTTPISTSARVYKLPPSPRLPCQRQGRGSSFTKNDWFKLSYARAKCCGFRSPRRNDTYVCSAIGYSPRFEGNMIFFMSSRETLFFTYVINMTQRIHLSRRKF